MQEILHDFKSNLSKGLGIHVLCWCLFILYEVGFISVHPRGLAEIESYVLFYGLNISLFYFHAFWVMPQIFEAGKFKVWKLSFIVIELVFYILLVALINLFLIEVLNVGRVLTLEKMFFVNSIFRGIYFMLYSTGCFFLVRFISNKEKDTEKTIQLEQLNVELLEVNNQLLQAELDYLRAQINPHLLFNTLNFIKYSVNHSPTQAREAIMLLSSILGFATDRANKDKVMLKNEIVQVDNIIRLNQLRFGGRLNIVFDNQIQNGSNFIIPVIILTLVENIFKHGELHDIANPAEISLIHSSERLICRTSNLIANTIEEGSTKAGLKSIALRLEKILPGEHVFVYGADGKRFNVSLEMKYQ